MSYEKEVGVQPQGKKQNMNILPGNHLKEDKECVNMKVAELSPLNESDF